jgi:hypothetical protein
MAQWTASSGVGLNNTLTGFLNALAAKSSVPVHVTSGLRSASAQANAMFSKIARGEDLTKLYADTSYAKAMHAAYPDKARGTAIVSALIAAGKAGSGHLGGRGLDLRTNGLSPGQVKALKSTVESLGAKVIVESDHMHVQGIGQSFGEQLMSTGTERKTSILATKALGIPAWGWVMGGLGGALLLTVVAAVRRR